ncbi:hypothetical protein PL9631_250035 [Planktothrix paucivesiculata PCC 9631]|uniref:Uncharacterized protein n=1 Tax=Planktothrix paucivesiculata PCC 9631 TaxID=671071 RepID=A0A7Z9BL99_9CYAN|nr:hypothetical protein PL9631_250035 [Planktothrix paucivesiculata PCC 9631]
MITPNPFNIPVIGQHLALLVSDEESWIIDIRQSNLSKHERNTPELGAA